MKINSRKLLVLLYTPKEEKVFCPSSREISAIFSDLSSEGVRSLLFSLRKKRLVARSDQAGEARYLLTDLGRQMVERLFPFLKPQISLEKPSEIVILFNPSAPQVDMRPLRDFLKKEGALMLQKGVYLYTAPFPSRILDFCQQYYFSDVLIFTIKEWVHGNSSAESALPYGDETLKVDLSGISREVEVLITKKLSENTLIYQSFFTINSVFNRFYFIVFEPSNIDPNRYLYSKKIRRTLSDLQGLFR